MTSGAAYESKVVGKGLMHGMHMVALAEAKGWKSAGRGLCADVEKTS